MTESRQAHDLNGAYYGPSIQPESYNPPSRDDSHRCCGAAGLPAGSFSETPSRLRSSIYYCCVTKLFFTLVPTISILLIGIILWFVFHTADLKFHVTDTSLTQFNLTTTTTNNNNNNSILYYNLALNMTVSDPNKHARNYTRIEAKAYYYEDYRFSTVTLTPFYQSSHKNSTYHLSFVVKGQSLMFLGISELSKFNSEKISGVYSIDMKLCLRIKDDSGEFKTNQKYKIKCALKVPLSSNGISIGGFKPTKCH